MLMPFIGFVPAMIAHGANLSRQLWIRGNYESAFAGSDLLVGIEREHGGIAKAADLPALVRRADRLARIFDHPKPMATGNLEDRLHLGGAAKGMNSDNGACARRDGSLNALGINVEISRLDIHEYRGGTLISHSIRHRNKSERGHDHFIPCTDSKRTDAQM